MYSVESFPIFDTDPEEECMFICIGYYSEDRNLNTFNYCEALAIEGRVQQLRVFYRHRKGLYPESLQDEIMEYVLENSARYGHLDLVDEICADFPEDDLPSCAFGDVCFMENISAAERLYQKYDISWDAVECSFRNCIRNGMGEMIVWFLDLAEKTGKVLDAFEEDSESEISEDEEERISNADRFFSRGIDRCFRELTDSELIRFLEYLENRYSGFGQILVENGTIEQILPNKYYHLPLRKQLYRWLNQNEIFPNFQDIMLKFIRRNNDALFIELCQEFKERTESHLTRVVSSINSNHPFNIKPVDTLCQKILFLCSIIEEYSFEYTEIKVKICDSYNLDLFDFSDTRMIPIITETERVFNFYIDSPVFRALESLKNGTPMKEVAQVLGLTPVKQDIEIPECPICYEVSEVMCQMKYHPTHLFCLKCFLVQSQTKRVVNCAICREENTLEDIKWVI